MQKKDPKQTGTHFGLVFLKLFSQCVLYNRVLDKVATMFDKVERSLGQNIEKKWKLQPRPYFLASVYEPCLGF